MTHTLVFQTSDTVACAHEFTYVEYRTCFNRTTVAHSVRCKVHMSRPDVHGSRRLCVDAKLDASATMQPKPVERGSANANGLGAIVLEEAREALLTKDSCTFVRVRGHEEFAGFTLSAHFCYRRVSIKSGTAVDIVLSAIPATPAALDAHVLFAIPP